MGSVLFYIIYNIYRISLKLNFHSNSGLSNGGIGVCFNDITGQYASLVFGIANSFGQMTGLFIPYMVGSITKNVNILLKFNQLSKNLNEYLN